MTGVAAGLRLAFLLAQGGAAAQPTVGDTVWLSRTVAAPPGYTVRAADWTPESPVELLGPARVVVRGDSAEIGYPVTLWEPGRHVIEVPGPVLVGPNGVADSAAAEPRAVAVASVLPDPRADSLPPPQPAARVIPRVVTSPLPLALLWLAAAAVLVPVHRARRRRGPAVPPRAPPAAAEPPVERWARAGEDRAVAAAAAARLRQAIAAGAPAAHRGLDTDACLAAAAAARPDWPLAELTELLREADGARFGGTRGPRGSAALGLHRRAADLAARLGGPG